MILNLGYANLNAELKAKNIYTNRTIKKATLEKQGLNYLSTLWISNIQDLKLLLEWNVKNNIKFFRLSADIIPWASKVDFESMPNISYIKELFKDCGNFINHHQIRITMHPGPFNLLASPNPNVVENSFQDLNVHALILNLMNQSKTVYNKINIHIGATYNDKNKAATTWIENFEKLPFDVRSRLTIENDDKANMYSVVDLHNLIYTHTKTPIVFDYHHHTFNTGNLSEEEALKLAISTWPQNITPVVHYSESKALEENNLKIRMQAHSINLTSLPNTYNQNVDCMLETKGKESTLLEIRKKYEI